MTAVTSLSHRALKILHFVAMFAWQGYSAVLHVIMHGIRGNLEIIAYRGTLVFKRYFRIKGWE